ncbi:protein-glutamate O-methyltransferase CheR [Antribacter sp. KLBMP9083]|uniref:Protein-glutamate O-methyltransferase CheR n=1 Tax=Antribacter soli TaxID=2910976 RepID=A0AA41QHC4_9MICO|nr:protein-glutamate O-methyltransferase CheR [Antribacter soli]MCF4123143.1 protein-glutamate O-methyltransferase CheR [Antribacter soli]
MTHSHAFETVVDQAADLLHLRIGLRQDKTLRGRLRRAVREEAARHGQDPTAYLDRLMVDAEWLQGLMDRVTVQETGFFRHPEQFEVLVREVLPNVPRPVRIWSAGCANGQEAYTLAMLLEEHRIDGSVIATDLSTAALRRTAAGRYSGREVSGLSPNRIERHFTRTGDNWEVKKSVRARVGTLHHNLLDPLPPEVLSCQVVFCRNVLIYLSPEQVRLFLDRIARSLTPTTTLVIGAAETIWQASDRFRAVNMGDTFIYRQRVAGLGSAPRRAGQDEPARRHAAPTATPRPRSGNPTRASRVAPGGSTRSITRAERPPAAPEPAEPADRLETAGQYAIAAGDYDAAVVAFRKWAYLEPHDPVAQLNLGLALEAAGDEGSARRAFAAARRALTDAGPDHTPAGLEGYAAAELLKLLDSKA